MKKTITEIINKNGIKDVGFCSFTAVAEHLIDCRTKLLLPENAKTVIVMLFPYKVREEKPYNISRYAAVPDYHAVCGKYLESITNDLREKFENNKFEWFIDNSPIPEVYAAAASGLGLKGENGLLINSVYGSWCFIGEIVTDIEIDCEKSLKKCLLCGNCNKACPRGIHGTDCLSAVSQRKNGLKNEEITALRENNIVWGCDICAEVCPLNKNAQTTYIKEFINGYRDGYEIGEDISGRAYCWRGEKTVRRNAEFLTGEQPKIISADTSEQK